MKLLIQINNPNKLTFLMALLEEFQFVSNIEIVNSSNKKKSREESLARIMKGCDLSSFGDGLEFQRKVRGHVTHR